MVVNLSIFINCKIIPQGYFINIIKNCTILLRLFIRAVNHELTEQADILHLLTFFELLCCGSNAFSASSGLLARSLIKTTRIEISSLILEHLILLLEEKVCHVCDEGLAHSCDSSLLNMKVFCKEKKRKVTFLNKSINYKS